MGSTRSSLVPAICRSFPSGKCSFSVVFFKPFPNQYAMVVCAVG